MRAHTEYLWFNTRQRRELVNITERLADVDRSVDFLRRPLCEALNEIAQTDTAKPPALAISARR